MHHIAAGYFHIFTNIIASLKIAQRRRALLSLSLFLLFLGSVIQCRGGAWEQMCATIIKKSIESAAATLVVAACPQRLLFSLLLPSDV